MKKRECRLCSSQAPEFFRDKVSGAAYFHCPECDLRFLDPAHYLNRSDEEARYRLHENHAEDEGYQNFTRPVLDLIAQKQNTLDILDFGCGADPVIRHCLRESAHRINLYDPYFFPDREVLNQQYDFIAMIEVAEHLYQPGEIFGQLKELLKPDGELGVMTSLVLEGLDFPNWWYRKDPTHVCFFSPKTMTWIGNRFGFSKTDVLSPKLILFTL